MLLDGFSNDFRTANLVLPTPPDLTCADPGSAGPTYLASVAAILSAPELPERLRAALVTLEAAASPQIQDYLDATIQRRIPCVTLRIGGHLAKGYDLTDFAQPFSPLP